jgi:uncharacterized phage-associated protein
MEPKTSPGTGPAIDAATLSRAIIARQTSVSGIRLVKLAYLAEVRYLERTGQRLSDADWFSWKHGPYSKKIVHGARDQAPAVVRREERQVLGTTANFYSAGPDCPPDLPAEVSTFLDEFLTVYGHEDTQAVISAAYRTAPFLRARAGKKIDLRGWGRSVSNFRSAPDVQAMVRAGFDGPRVKFRDVRELTEWLAAMRLPGDGVSTGVRNH